MRQRRLLHGVRLILISLLVPLVQADGNAGWRLQPGDEPVPLGAAPFISQDAPAPVSNAALSGIGRQLAGQIADGPAVSVGHPPGLSDAAIWQLFELQAPPGEPLPAPLYLSYDNHFLSHIQAFLLDESFAPIAAAMGGALAPQTYNKRAVNRTLLRLDPGNAQRRYLLVRRVGNTPLGTAMSLHTEASVDPYRERQSAQYWAVMCVLLVTFLFSASLLYTDPGSAYRWLLGYYALALVFFAVLEGYGHLLLPPALFRLLSQQVMTMNWLFLWLLYSFSHSFLSFRALAGRQPEGAVNPSPFLRPWFWHLQRRLGPLLLILAGLSVVVPQAVSLVAFSVVSLLAFALVVGRAGTSVRRGYWPAWLLLAAITIQAFGAVVGTGRYLELMPATWFTHHAYLIATLSTMGLLSFSVAVRLRYLEGLQWRLERTDDLTGYPNQTYVQENLSTLWQSRLRSGKVMALVMVKVKGLGALAASMGPRAVQAVSQSLLAEFNPVLQRQLPALEFPEFRGHYLALVARDEAVFLLDSGDEIAPFDITRLAPYTRTSIRYQRNRVTVHSRFGVYCADTPDESLDQALRKVSAALVGTRGTGSDVVEYTAEMDQRFLRRSWLNQALQTALESDSIETWVQPQYDLNTARVVGAELLARWHHETAGTISPDEFVPVAERTGQIFQLSRLMLKRAFAWLSRHDDWQHGLSVNISAADLENPELLPLLVSLSEQYSVPSRSITLEITESAIMKNRERSLAAVETLKGAGFRFSIDDFGTGYSSLAYLSRIRPDEIKIDREFIGNCDTSQISRSIVHSVLQLARSLNAGTIAEGVETDAQRLTLSRAGCRCAQGYFWSAAVPLDSDWHQPVPDKRS